MTGAIAHAPRMLAQDAAPQTVVLDSETSEGRGRVLANVYFTLQDEAGRPFPDAEIQSAAVLLEDGRQFPATIEKPPYYVALVIDASGSMSAVLPNVQETAVNLVNVAPQTPTSPSSALTKPSASSSPSPTTKRSCWPPSTPSP